MVPAFAVATMVGFAGVALAPTVVGGWAAIALIVLFCIIGLIGASSLGFFLWGRYLGFSWHFTP